MYPDLPRKQRETRSILQKYPAIFIIGIGWVLEGRLPARDARRRLRRLGHADDRRGPARPMHGLNGDILVWNPVTKRRHELTSMGIRVTKETLRQQLEITGQLDFLKLPYHQAILNDQIPLSIGGGIGQSRTVMLPAAQGAPRRGQRHRVAEGAQGDLREEEHPRPRVTHLADGSPGARAAASCPGLFFCGGPHRGAAMLGGSCVQGSSSRRRAAASTAGANGFCR